jgi:hypothetical protein
MWLKTRHYGSSIKRYRSNNLSNIFECSQNLKLAYTSWQVVIGENNAQTMCEKNDIHNIEIKLLENFFNVFFKLKKYL